MLFDLEYRRTELHSPEDELQLAREELSTAVEEVRSQLNHAMAWKTFFRTNQSVFIAGAFLLGFLVGFNRSQDTDS